jgi:hypothetical protein
MRRDEKNPLLHPAFQEKSGNVGREVVYLDPVE